MPPEKQKKGSRLSTGEILLILAFTGSIDALQILISWILDWIVIGLLINWCIDFLMGWFLFFWFNSHNISFKGTKKIIVWGAALFKFVPFIGDGFPLWILDIIFVIIIVKIEDKVGLKNPEQIARAGNRTLTLMAKNKRMGAIMDSTKQGKEIRQQILANQRQTLTKKESGKPTQVDSSPSNVIQSPQQKEKSAIE